MSEQNEYLTSTVVQCKLCKKDVEIPLTESQYDRLDDCLSNGAYDGMVCRAVPDLAPEYREMYISGFCPECFSKIFEPFDELAGNEG